MTEITGTCLFLSVIPLKNFIAHALVIIIQRFIRFWKGLEKTHPTRRVSKRDTMKIKFSVDSFFSVFP